MRVELPPGGATDRHRHPGQEYVYVVSGSIVIEPDGAAPIALAAGQAQVNPANEVHRVRNPRAAAPRVIVVALIPQGSPAVIIGGPRPPNSPLGKDNPGALAQPGASATASK